MTTYSLVVQGKPLTMNKLNNLHHAVYAKHRQFWRDAFTTAALEAGVPAIGSCTIMVDHIKPTRRNIDVTACAPSVKAGIDGLVAVGVLTDDTPEFVRSVTFNAPDYQAGVEALVLTLVTGTVDRQPF